METIMRIKFVLIAFILATLLAGNAQAASITITLDRTTLSGNPGQTVAFFGTIMNTSSDTIYLNDVDFNLAGTGFSSNAQDRFFSNVPLFLNPHSSSGDIELFDVTLLKPFTDPLGTYAGTYTLTGGLDGSADEVLALAGFSVAAVPEPSSVLLVFSGLAGLAVIMRRRRTTQ
jgi:hypothetical protein